jgi:curved DNA-binding protein CbpA
MRARALLLAALTALACARPCSPSGFADAMDVAAARRVLGVEGVASAEQTRAAFHRASLRAHPDKPGGSHEAFVEVTEAYEVLRNGAAAPSRSGFPSGESRRGGAGGHSRGGGAASDDHAERESSESHESHAWRFSFSSDADAGDADAERSARARSNAFEQFQKSRRAWGESGDFDADKRFSKNENRGGTGRRTWWDGGRRVPERDAYSGDAFYFREDRAARARDDDRRRRRHHHRTDGQYEPIYADDYVYGEHANTRGGDRDTYDKWWDTRQSDLFAGRFGGAVSENGARVSPHASRDDLESMEEYVYRRAWADARGVAGHDRRLHDGEADSFSSEAPFLETQSPYGDDADFGWDAARRRASDGGA